MKLTDIKGIGPKKQAKLNEMGIYDIGGYIEYLPRYYEDRSNLVYIENSVDGEKQYFELEIANAAKTYIFKKNMSITRVVAKDDTSSINLVWYNDRFSPQSLKIGTKYKFFGKIDKSKKQISNPLFSKLDDDYIGWIYPIYSVIKGLSRKEFIQFKDTILDNTKIRSDYLPEKILEQENLVDINDMFKILHRPDSYLDLYKAKLSYVTRQLVVEHLANKLFNNIDNSYIKHKAISLTPYTESLDFELTQSQQQVLSEISYDMYSDKKMNRIVIGDVGSGKTIVAILSAIIAIKNGYQVAFMAPTELLSIQHHNNFKSYLNKFDIRSELLIGSTSTKDKRSIYRDLQNNDIDILFGTHALFQEKLEFNNLGLVITDEQQRFGVYQRKLLSEKGSSPDILLLSATPIPRTLALTMYQDLDLSIIDTLPSNRKPIESFLVSENMERRFLKFAVKQIQEGRQVYVVCPRVSDDEDSDVNSVENIYKRYKKFFEGRIRIDYIHGQLDVESKTRKQQLFANGDIDMLIATSIIEVGIDVKNANLMIIYNANYFGLSQLHQLRGRIGRGNYQSYCIFVASDGKIEDEKLKFIETNNNGFEIARKDLELRGAGDRFGVFQSGFTSDNMYEIYDEDLYSRVNRIVMNLFEDKSYESNIELKKQIENKMLEYKKIILN